MKRIYLFSGVLFGAALIVWPLSPTFIQMLVDAYRNAYIGDPELPRLARRMAPAATVLSGIYWRSWPAG